MLDIFHYSQYLTFYFLTFPDESVRVFKNYRSSDLKQLTFKSKAQSFFKTSKNLLNDCLKRKRMFSLKVGKTEK